MNNKWENEVEYPELTMNPRILLGPGPSMVHPRVLRAISAPIIGHLDPEFLKIMDDTQDLLRYIFETENQLTIPISGTGSAAMEASIANMVEPGDAVLVCINGYFGLRLSEMIKKYDGIVYSLEKPWGEIFTPREIKEALDNQSVDVVAIVHAETSTGVVQPLDGIIDIVHSRGGVIIVDAVTSLGGLPVSVDNLDIDVCYSGSQKCIGCPPGLGPITLGPRAIDRLNYRKNKVANWYLDLSMIQEYWGDERTYHHTAPISMNFALYEGLRIIAEEGLEKRWARHQKNAELLWEGLEELGLKLFVPREYRCPTLTTVTVPKGVDEERVRGQLLEQYNIEIAGGLGELKGKVWRIGLMGYSSRENNVLLLISALQKILLD